VKYFLKDNKKLVPLPHIFVALNLAPNGPAVEGVNFGGADHRYESRYFSQEVVPAASHHGVTFASALTDRRERQGIPAKDDFVSVAGFDQSRSHEFGRRVQSFV
jgi:hypothetical protein